MKEVSPLHPEVAELVKRYRTVWKRTAKDYIDLGVVIADAHDQLGKLRLADFYREIRMEQDGPTSSKLRAIGNARNRFLPLVDKLPNSWTTLYALTKYETDQFNDAVANDRIHPEATWEEIAGKKRSDGQEKRRVLTININNVGAARRGDFAKRIKELFKEFNLEMQKPQRATLDEFLAPYGGEEKK
jgi:hypothetical protein